MKYPVTSNKFNYLCKWCLTLYLGKKKILNRPRSPIFLNFAFLQCRNLHILPSNFGQLLSTQESLKKNVVCSLRFYLTLQKDTSNLFNTLISQAAQEPFSVKDPKSNKRRKEK